MTRVAVMGSGSWGTAFSMVLSHAGCDVVLWAREERLADLITREHHNPDYQPGIELPISIRATADASVALEGAEIVVLALPSEFLREHLTQWAQYLNANALLVSLIKGIELGTSLRMSEVIREVTGVDEAHVAVVSGPNLAREIAQGQPAATTVACADEGAALRLQEACTSALFRPYWTTDVVGAEIGGSVKNVIALANGMAVGIGFGENAQAALITRGLVEMTRLGVALDADAETFLGLAGIGDLMATCHSPLSRNRTFGESLGRGLSVDQTIAATKQTCEGVKSCQPILDLAQRHGVDMPITEQVVNVVHHQMPPAHMLAAFMRRETKAEGID